MKKPLIIFLICTAVLLPFDASSEQITKQEAKKLITPFYDLFSMKGSEEKARKVFSQDWKSYYSNIGYKDLDGTMQFVNHVFPAMVPNMEWTLDDLSVTLDNQIIVRGTFTGTPAGTSFFGQKVSGKSFSIMTIDVHHVQNGKITKSYHIEDWFTAIEQLTADS